MRTLDLFSGIGGFSIAGHLLGMETAAFVEWDRDCQAVLATRFPGVPIHADITTVSAADAAGWGPVDLVTGGYPCQGFSVAGQRRGQADDRYLWPAMRRVIALTQPRYVLAENVAGHVSLGLDQTLADLEADGYAAWPVVVPAVAAGALHRRDRVWILAVADPRRHAGRSSGDQDDQAGPVDATVSRRVSGTASDLADADDGFSQRSLGSIRAGRDAAGGGGEAVADTASQSEREPGDWRQAVDPERLARLELGRCGSRQCGDGPDRTVADADRRGAAQPEGAEPRQRRWALDGSEAGRGAALPHASSSRRGPEQRHLHAGQPDAAGRGQGRPADRGAVTGVRGVADGATGWLDRPEPARLTERSAGRSRRLKQLGNAIYWPVAYEILRPIAVAEGLVAA